MSTPGELSAAASSLRRRMRPVTLEEFADCADELARLLGIGPTAAMRALLDAGASTNRGEIALELRPGDRSSARGQGWFVAAVSVVGETQQAIFVSLSSERGNAPVGATAVEVECAGIRHAIITDAMGSASLADLPRAPVRLVVPAPWTGEINVVLLADEYRAGQDLRYQLGELCWEVAPADLGQPRRLSVRTDPRRRLAPWTKQAVMLLLGPGGVDGLERAAATGSSGTLPSAGATDRTLAMGLLALASATHGGAPDPARSFDTAVLLHRAGLDAVGLALPGREAMAIEARAVLDGPLRPVQAALASQRPKNAGWRLAKSSMNATRSFVGRALGALTDDEAIEREAAALLATLEEPVLVSASGDLGDGRPPGWVLRLDAGAVGLEAVEVTPAADEGRLYVRALASREPLPPLWVRLVRREATAVVTTAALEWVGVGREYAAALEGVDVGAADLVVEILGDRSAPVLTDAEARSVHAASCVRDALRALQKASLVTDDGRVSRTQAAKRLTIAAIASLEEANAVGSLQLEVNDLVPAPVGALPSDAIGVVLADLAAHLVAALSTVVDVDARLGRCRETIALAQSFGGADVLAGECLIMEAGILRQRGPTARQDAQERASSAVRHFAVARDNRRLAGAMDVLAQLRAQP